VAGRGAFFQRQHVYAAPRLSHAVEYYSYLAAHFPDSKNAAAAHWRAGWLSYRQGLYADAARLFDEQIRLYPAATETVSALYWRGRLYETQDHKPAQAAANYRTIVRAYQHFFYAQMARQRLAALGNAQAAGGGSRNWIAPAAPVPRFWWRAFPADSPHLAKARLLANAGLNDYIAQEIAADPDSSSWSALAEAQIYASYGETYRAMRALKKALPYAATASIKSIPLAYWRILFPEPVVGDDQGRVGQEQSRSVPGGLADSPGVGVQSFGRLLCQRLRADATAAFGGQGDGARRGNQPLPDLPTARSGDQHPAGNALSAQMLDRFGGVQEYALAAYNAGDERVVDWQAAGPYRHRRVCGVDSVYADPRICGGDPAQRETYKAIDAALPVAGAGHGGERAVPIGAGIAWRPVGNPFRYSPHRFQVDLGRGPGNTEFDRRSPHFGMPFAACCCSKTEPAKIHWDGLGYINPPEGTMSADLQFLEEWIPERMDPGTVFVLENQAKLGHAQNPFVAVMSCPRCGTLGLITRRQLLRRRDDDLRRRRLLGRVPAGRREHADLKSADRKVVGVQVPLWAPLKRSELRTNLQIADLFIEAESIRR
jgi:hypothetical protein